MQGSPSCNVVRDRAGLDAALSSVTVNHSETISDIGLSVVKHIINNKTIPSHPRSLVLIAVTLYQNQMGE